MGMLRKDKFDYYLNDVKGVISYFRSKAKTRADTYDKDIMKEAREKFLAIVSRHFP